MQQVLKRHLLYFFVKEFNRATINSKQLLIDAMEKHDYFSFLHLHTQKFINELKNRLNSISLSDNDLLQKQ